jgi:transposase
MRAEMLFTELDVLSELRPKAKRAMVAEARRHRAWKILLGIPFFGPVRVAQLISIVVTPHRFRGKRQLWPYAGLAVVTRSSADYEQRNGRFERRRRPPMTRGLNRNHNPVLKDVFKGAAQAAIGRPGPLKDLYDASVARGVAPEMAKLTLARKIASVTLRLWKRGERYDPAKLTMQAT